MSGYIYDQNQGFLLVHRAEILCKFNEKYTRILSFIYTERNHIIAMRQNEKAGSYYFFCFVETIFEIILNACFLYDFLNTGLFGEWNAKANYEEYERFNKQVR